MLNKMYPVRVKPRLGYTNLLAGIRTNENLATPLAAEDVRVHIIQIGAGGTGGYVAAEIMRYMGALPPVLKNKVYYTLMDGDKFEAKNLGRQLCSPEDIGENKAEALISNLAPMFDCNMDNIAALPRYLTHPRELMGLTNSFPFVSYNKDRLVPFASCVNTPQNYKHSGHYSPESRPTQVISIVIDCVDKTNPRRIIHTALERQYHPYDEFAFLKEACNRSLTYLNHWRAHQDKFEWITESEKDSYANGNEHPKYYVTMYIDENNHIINEWRDKETDEIINTKDLGSPLTLSGFEVLPVYPETYVISSGNGHYTGQVYWGRYSRVFRHVAPLTYGGMYGDQDVNPILGSTTPEDAAERLKKHENLMLNRHMWPLVADPVDPRKATQQVMDALFVHHHKTNDDRSYRAYDAKLRDAVTGELIEDPVYASEEAFVSAHVSVPSPYIRHPELIDLEVDRREEQLSCADRAAENIQNINANKTAAMLVINYFSAIMNGIFPLEGEPVQPISTAGVTFDIRSNNMVAEPITTDYLRKYATTPTIPDDDVYAG